MPTPLIVTYVVTLMVVAFSVQRLKAYQQWAAVVYVELATLLIVNAIFDIAPWSDFWGAMVPATTLGSVFIIFLWIATWNDTDKVRPPS